MSRAKEIRASLLNDPAETFLKKLSDIPNCFEEVDENGWSVIHLAAIFGKYDVLRGLAGRAEERHLNRQDKDGLTPLSHAAYIGNEKCVYALLKLGGSQFLRDNEGMTPLDWSELSGNVLCSVALSGHNLQQEMKSLMDKREKRQLVRESKSSYLSQFALCGAAVVLFAFIKQVFF